MASSLSDLANNFSEEIQRIKCKFAHDDKKYEACANKYMYCHCFLDYTVFQDGLIENKSLCYNKNYEHKFDEKLKEQFFNT